MELAFGIRRSFYPQQESDSSGFSFSGSVMEKRLENGCALSFSAVLASMSTGWPSGNSTPSQVTEQKGPE